MFLAACAGSSPPPGAAEDVRRIVAALDDVHGEYAAANDVQLRILGSLVHDAQIYGSELPADEQAALGAVAAELARRGDPAPLARELRTALLSRHDLVLAPGAPPVRARAQQLWGMICTGCHGTRGYGDGSQGLGLVPEPKNLRDAGFMSTMSPSRAFSRLTEGVRGTAMPAWGTFTATERWGLAFLVMALRFDDAAAARGRALFEEGAPPVPPTLSYLADRTDGELLDELRRSGLTDERAADALAFLRREVAFAPPRGVFGEVRSHLATGLVEVKARRWRRGLDEVAAARRALLARTDAWRSVAAAASARAERHLSELAALVAAGELEEKIERQVVRLEAVLDAGERSSGSGLAAGWLMVQLGLLPALAAGALSSRRRCVAGVLLGLVGGIVAARLGGVAPGVAQLLLGLAVLGRAGAPALAALVGMAAGILGASVVTMWPATAAAPLTGVGLALLGLMALAAAVRGVGLERRAPSLTALLVSAAAAACAARGVVGLLLTQDTPITLLAVPRIETLGVFPTVPSLLVFVITLLVGLGLIQAARGNRSSGGLP